MLNKRGKFTITQILGLVLGVASAVIIIILMVSILSPSFDKGEETAKGYFKSFMSQIEVANNDEVGEFSMWQAREAGTNARRYFLVYFADGYKHNEDGKDFASFEINENHICLCYTYDDESHCNYCENLKFPVNSWEDYGRWDIDEQKKIRIELTGGEYVITMV